MATLTERADEAIDVVEGDLDLLWALAANDRPVDRDYLIHVTGMERRRLVRTLARLANAGVLAETEGIVFALERDAVRDELLQRAPADRLLTVHELSLDWARTRAADDPRRGTVDASFELAHAVGARRFEETAPALADALRGAVEPIDRRVLELAKRTLLGLMDHAGENRTAILALGIELLDRGRAVLKPMEIRNLTATLRELDSEDRLGARLTRIEDEARNEARLRRQKKRAAAPGDGVATSQGGAADADPRAPELAP